MDTQTTKPHNTILIEHGKCGDTYWNATGTKMYEAALRILEGRVRNGYISNNKHIEATIASQDLTEAWAILCKRRHYEYEGFELAVLLDTDEKQGD